MKKAGILLALLCMSAATPSASIGPPVDVAARARGASRVVIATVVDVQSRFDVSEWGDQLIVSDALVDVDEILKGASASSVVVTVEGGTIGDLTLEVSDMPSLRKGDRAVLFLEVARNGTLRPNGRGNGVLKLDSSNRVAGTNLTVNDVKRVVREAR